MIPAGERPFWGPPRRRSMTAWVPGMGTAALCSDRGRRAGGEQEDHADHEVGGGAPGRAGGRSAASRPTSSRSRSPGPRRRRRSPPIPTRMGHYLLAASTFPPPQAKPEHDKAFELGSQGARPGEQKHSGRHRGSTASRRARSRWRRSAVVPRDEVSASAWIHMMIGQLSLNQGQYDRRRQRSTRRSHSTTRTPRAHGLEGQRVMLMRASYVQQARAEYDAALTSASPAPRLAASSIPAR